jgi:hypothetical protein
METFEAGTQSPRGGTSVGSKLSDVGHIVLYTIIGLGFLLFGSHDHSPDWMPYLMALALTAGVGYCALGRYEERWKAVLWIVPGILGASLLLIWLAVWMMPTSTVQWGKRFAFWATPVSLQFQDAPAPGITPLVRQLPDYPLVMDFWHSRVSYGRVRAVPANAHAANAVQMRAFGNVQPPQWVTFQQVAIVSIPIWWPVGVLGGPTLLWELVIVVMWVQKRLGRAG